MNGAAPASRSADAPSVVILAAGASTRMGRCKALLDLDGQSAVRRLLDAASCPEAPDPPLVMTGADDDAIRRELAALAGVELVHHAGWRAGRTSTLQAAVAARPGRDLIVAPVDHPLVQRGIFDALREAWRSAGAPALGWLSPRVELDGATRYGHPLVIGRELLSRASGLAPDAPLRALRTLACPLLSVAADRSVLANLDRPGDLESFSGWQK